MSLIPVFEIGVWNAWIFELCALLPLPILLFIQKRRASKSEKGADSKSELDYMNETEKDSSLFPGWLCFSPSYTPFSCRLNWGRHGFTWVFLLLWWD